MRERLEDRLVLDRIKKLDRLLGQERDARGERDSWSGMTARWWRLAHAKRRLVAWHRGW